MNLCHCQITLSTGKPGNRLFRETERKEIRRNARLNYRTGRNSKLANALLAKTSIKVFGPKINVMPMLPEAGLQTGLPPHTSWAANYQR
jgi:hypothetical protein